MTLLIILTAVALLTLIGGCLWQTSRGDSEAGVSDTQGRDTNED